ncbi:MAG TPA: xanthine dehydrogenase family protein subunit M [Phycisphaerae bacterium]
MNAFEYLTADSFEAATGFLAKKPEGRTLVKAGGIDVLDRLKERLETPDRLLNLRNLPPAAKAIERRASENVLAIGALATLAEVAAHPEVKKLFPILAESLGDAATPQIRNVATIGGNLLQKPRCWYFRSQDILCRKKGGGLCYAIDGDNRYHAIFGTKMCHIVHASNAAVPLRAYGASVRTIRNENGKIAERVVNLDDFYRVPDDPKDDEHTLQPNEILKEILIPLSAGGTKSAYIELREKQSFDWPLVTVAVNLNDPVQPRIVLGAVAPIPWRLPNVEALIAGKPITAELADQAGEKATEGADPMTHNEYKVPQVQVLVSQALRTAAGV